MPIIDLVKWDAPSDLYAWKFPSDELSTWTQLVVSESQEALLLKGGEIVGHFRAGRHTLSTENVPLLAGIFKIPFGGKSPFKAEVWFVNRTIALDVKWGTADPIQLLDPRSKIMLPVRAFGQFGVQIEDTKRFLIKLVGTMPSFDRAQLISYFRGVTITRTKDIIAKKIIKDHISILEISAHLNDISRDLQEGMAEEFKDFGLQLVRFFVNSINVPEDDPAVGRLRDAYAKKAEMDIIGYTYQQERSFNTLEKAAENPGASGAPIMGAGLGLGMGFAMGGPIGKAMASSANVMNPGGANISDTIPCPFCNFNNQPNTKFCSQCGKSLAGGAARGSGIECDKCGATATAGARFCPSCGDPFFCCPKCGTDNSEGSAHCRNCNEPLPVKCKECGSMSPGASKFCMNCGKPLAAMCKKCDAAIPNQAKFCPACGTPSGS